jgi:penicillin-binding protein 1A
MTGGSLPAMAWHDMMLPAHQGLELRPIPGLAPAAPTAATAARTPETAGPQRPVTLNRRAVETITDIEAGLRALSAAGQAAAPATALTGTVARNSPGTALP